MQGNLYLAKIQVLVFDVGNFEYNNLYFELYLLK